MDGAPALTRHDCRAAPSEQRHAPALTGARRAAATAAAAPCPPRCARAPGAGRRQVPHSIGLGQVRVSNPNPARTQSQAVCPNRVVRRARRATRRHCSRLQARQDASEAGAHRSAAGRQVMRKSIRAGGARPHLRSSRTLKADAACSKGYLPGGQAQAVARAHAPCIFSLDVL